MKYAYFVITPGVEPKSFVQYQNAKGNYFKFGDTKEDTLLGIRKGYTTHNPDIGIAGVLTNGFSQGNNLGTRIKNDIIQDRYKTVPGTEWFSVNNKQAWALFTVVQRYDGETIDGNNYDTFMKAVLAALNNNP